MWVTTDNSRYAATTDDIVCVVCRRAVGTIVCRLMGRIVKYAMMKSSYPQFCG